MHSGSRLEQPFMGVDERFDVTRKAIKVCGRKKASSTIKRRTVDRFPGIFRISENNFPLDYENDIYFVVKEKDAKDITYVGRVLKVVVRSTRNSVYTILYSRYDYIC